MSEKTSKSAVADLHQQPPGRAASPGKWGRAPAEPLWHAGARQGNRRPLPWGRSCFPKPHSHPLEEHPAEGPASPAGPGEDASNVQLALKHNLSPRASDTRNS